MNDYDTPTGLYVLEGRKPVQAKSIYEWGIWMQKRL